MHSSSRHIILFIYNSFNDPLFKGLLLTYIKKINAVDPNFNFHIITYEQKKYALTKQQKEKTTKELIKQNIYWHPLTYHSGRFILLKKTWDFTNGFFKVLFLKIKTRSNVLLSFTNIAGSVGFIFSRILNLKFIVFSYEPHSEFLADFGLWERGSLQFKCLNKLEHLMGRHGEHIITGTQYLVNELKVSGAKGKAYRIPSCVDEEKFKFDAIARNAIRARYNIGSRKCLIYVGKFGDLYYREEVPLLFKRILHYEPDFFFLVITPQDSGEIENLFLSAGVNQNEFAITSSSYDKVQDYISAADIGLIAIRPASSQRFRSPVKTGEYLMCGVPYIVCRGISEDDFYAEQNQVGIVIDDFITVEGRTLIQKMDILFDEAPQVLRDRCRKVGIAYRGMNPAVETLKSILEETVA